MTMMAKSRRKKMMTRRRKAQGKIVILRRKAKRKARKLPRRQRLRRPLIQKEGGYKEISGEKSSGEEEHSKISKEGGSGGFR